MSFRNISAALGPVALSSMSVDAVEKRLGYLAKSLDMNSDAVALLMHKAESLRGLLQMQSLVTAETGVSQKYQEKIDELAGQVSDSTCQE